MSQRFDNGRGMHVARLAREGLAEYGEKSNLSQCEDGSARKVLDRHVSDGGVCGRARAREGCQMLEARWTRVMSGRGETSAYKRRTLGGWRAENKRDWGRLEHLLWGLGSFEVRREILILQGMPINGESEFAGMVQSARVPSPESPSAWHALCLPQQGPRGICFFLPSRAYCPRHQAPVGLPSRASLARSFFSNPSLGGYCSMFRHLFTSIFGRLGPPVLA